MDISTQLLLHLLVILAVVKDCTAYCYGYCWYGSWYIWFAVIMTLAIGCGALGSYLRRRRLQQAMLRAQQAEVHTVQVSGNVQVGVIPPTSDLSRPYVYPQAGYPSAPPNAGVMTPPPYAAAVNASQPTKRPEDLEGLPPSYVEAIQAGNNMAPPQAYPGQQAPTAPAGQAPPPMGQQPPYPPQPQAPGYAPPYPQQHDGGVATGPQQPGTGYPNK